MAATLRSPPRRFGTFYEDSHSLTWPPIALTTSDPSDPDGKPVYADRAGYLEEWSPRS